ncbi:hypothetical protein [Heyndrickxia camelliae]|uniref:Uncharacterized protein n=1 Tax=Heyndrickxia camelliae TaxID=1707093 RepID=A0A2N3LNA0_9BACI|nr:hypothetical protein [Heyndrickxia camelliae]PKR86111.1 hypothetical protein CWO92_06990 [Heyndrickxia camelliae]
MEIKDERPVLEECREGMFNLIRGITKETGDEQKHRYVTDALYRSTIDYLAQMLFVIKTDERFIAEEKKAQAEYMHYEMKKHLKLYGVDIE